MPARKPKQERKDRIVQARVNDRLGDALKAEADRRRLPVSQLIRNLLEDTFSLVGNVVDNVDAIARDAVDLGRQAGDDARRLARNVQPPSKPPAPEQSTADPAELSDVYAWQGVVTNSDQDCARCRRALERGSEAFIGLSDTDGPRRWLCAPCRTEL